MLHITSSSSRPNLQLEKSLSSGTRKVVDVTFHGRVFHHREAPWLILYQALDFFPSIQQVVSGFVALSGDFHGYGNKTLLSVSGVGVY